MRNVLFFCSWQLKPVHHGLVIEKLKEVCNSPEVENIVFISCATGLMPCYSNPKGKESLCQLCMFHTRVALKPYEERIKHVQIGPEANKLHESFKYGSVADIKKIEHRGVKIGLGAMSSYISTTRNIEPLMSTEFRRYVDAQLSYQVQLTDVVYDQVEKHRINEIYFFNGRTSDTRPLYDIARLKEINFTSLELIRESNESYRVNEFPNCLPHDISYHDKRITALWNKNANEQTIEEAADFFRKRREGQLVRDRKVYTKDQEEGKLPEGFDENQKNIVIYNSSQDEFVSLGDFIEDKSLYPVHEEGLKALFEEFNGDESYHFYLRLHPNLREVKYTYHQRLKDLGERYANVTVIGADSDISSYSLLDKADQVITFGSTVGAEACFWRKPVILLAGSLYYYLDVAYIPKTKEEFFELIRSDLAPRSKEDALKFGMYMMNYHSYTRKNSYDPKAVRFLGLNVGRMHPHLRIMGSKLLFTITDRILRLQSTRRKDAQFEIPMEEYQTK
jgi:hypothetical protein